MDKKIVVVKIGTRVLVSSLGKICSEVINSLAKQIASTYKQGFRPIIVTSGAIACGNGVAFGGKDEIVDQQVAAMVGQPKLMAHWHDAFKQWGLVVGQGLGTHQDFCRKETVDAIHRMLELRIIPVLNENDFVSTEEIKKVKLHGDNDVLAAVVTKAIGAERLILLSDVDGLYDGDLNSPGSSVIPVVEVINEDIMALAKEPKSGQRSTGMKPKLQAAKEVTEAGIVVNLANGNLDDVVTRIIGGRDVPGTTFLAQI